MATDKTQQWCNEQSQMFDVLYNNTASNQAPKLDDYEKSLFLTKAQDEIVKNHFTAISNPKGQGFDDNLKRQSEFAPLIATTDLTAATDRLSGVKKIDQRSILYIFPADYFLSINEDLYEEVDVKSESETSTETETNDNTDSNTDTATDTESQTNQNDVKQILYQYVVNPIQYGEYKRQMLKPYQYPVRKTAWRLFNGTTETVDTEGVKNQHIVAEVIGRFQTDNPTYSLRYVKHPSPIILTDIDSGDYAGMGLSING